MITFRAESKSLAIIVPIELGGSLKDFLVKFDNGIYQTDDERIIDAVRKVAKKNVVKISEDKPQEIVEDKPQEAVNEALKEAETTKKKTSKKK